MSELRRELIGRAEPNELVAKKLEMRRAKGCWKARGRVHPTRLTTLVNDFRQEGCPAARSARVNRARSGQL